MTTIAIGSGRFTLVGGAFAHNPLPRITPLMGDREASTAALTLPLRFGMGRWDCERLDGLAPDARAEAMAGYLRRAKATHWLRHDMTLRTDGATTLSAGAEAELWRRLEEGTRLSRGQMEDWLRRSFGTPPYAYVKTRRLERAQKLLATTDVPIKVVALDCGFCDQAHLTRMFSGEFGVTPAEFRRRAH